MIMSSRDLLGLCGLCIVLEILGLIFIVTVCIVLVAPIELHPVGALHDMSPCCGFLPKLHIGASMGIETIGQVSHPSALGTHETACTDSTEQHMFPLRHGREASSTSTRPSIHVQIRISPYQYHLGPSHLVHQSPNA
jgi:hypothetical protein